MFATHRHDLRFRPFALLHCPKVQVLVWILLIHAPDFGGAYTPETTPTIATTATNGRTSPLGSVYFNGLFPA